MWNLKKKNTNELIDTENRLVVARDTGWLGGEMGERHRLLVIK